VHARGFRVGEWQAIAMMVAGLGAALAWRWLGWQDMVYEGMPGMLAGWATFHVIRRFAGEPAPAVLTDRA
jgi:sodium/proline symporter